MKFREMQRKFRGERKREGEDGLFMGLRGVSCVNVYPINFLLKRLKRSESSGFSKSRAAP